MPQRAICVGAGKRAEWDIERQRRVATASALAARQRGMGRLAWQPRPCRSEADDAEVAAEGIALAADDGDTWKTAPRDLVALCEGIIISPSGGDAVERAVERGRLLGECSNLARRLANEPGNALPPRLLAEGAIGALAGSGVDVDVLDEAQLEALHMGLLLGVGRGSAEPPRLIVMRVRAGRLRVGSGPRPGRQGHHLRHRRHLDQAVRRHGAHEDDMTGGAAVIAAMRAHWPAAARRSASSGSSRQPRTCPAAGHQSGRRPDRGAGQDRRGEQHRRRGPARARRRVVVRPAAGRHPPRRRRHAHRRVRVAWDDSPAACLRTPDWWAIRLRQVADRCGDRVWPYPSTTTIVELLRSDIADSGQHGWPVGWGDLGGDVSEGIHRRIPVGPPRHCWHGVGRRSQSLATQGGNGRGRADARGAAVHCRASACLVIEPGGVAPVALRSRARSAAVSPLKWLPAKSRL